MCGGGVQGRDIVCNTLLRCRAISHHERPVTGGPAFFGLCASTQVAPVNALEGLASASTKFTRGVHVFICACLGECVRVRLRAHARERTCRCSAGEAGVFRQLGNSLWRNICLNLAICAAAEDLGALSVFDQSQCKGVAGLAVSGMRQAAAALKELSSNRVGTLDFAAEAESIAAQAAVSLSALP